MGKYLSDLVRTIITREYRNKVQTILTEKRAENYKMDITENTKFLAIGWGKPDLATIFVKKIIKLFIN